MKPEIKTAGRKDFKELATIYSEEFSKPPYNEKWTPKKAINKINLFSRYCKIYKVLLGKEIVGFFVLNENEWLPGEVVFGEEIAIKPEHQSKGIGTFVLKWIFRAYKQKGFKKFLAIGNRNSKAITLYKHLGIKSSKDSIAIEKEL